MNKFINNETEDALKQQKQDIITQLNNILLSESLSSFSKEVSSLNQKFKSLPYLKDYTRNKQLFEEFLTAKNTFYERVKLEYSSNYNRKVDIVSRITNLRQTTNNWTSATQEVKLLSAEFKQIGYAGQQSNELFSKFQTAIALFYDAKNSYYKKNKESQQKIAEKKREIINKMKAIYTRNFSDIKEAYGKMKELRNQYYSCGFASFNEEADLKRALEEVTSNLNCKIREISISHYRDKARECLEKIKTLETRIDNYNCQIVKYERKEYELSCKDRVRYADGIKQYRGYIVNYKNKRDNCQSYIYKYKESYRYYIEKYAKVTSNN